MIGPQSIHILRPHDVPFSILFPDSINLDEPIGLSQDTLKEAIEKSQKLHMLCFSISIIETGEIQQ